MSIQYLVCLSLYGKDGYSGTDYRLYDTIEEVKKFCQLNVEETVKDHPYIFDYDDGVNFSDIDYELACQVDLVDVDRVVAVGKSEDDPDFDLTNIFKNYIDADYALAKFEASIKDNI